MGGKETGGRGRWRLGRQFCAEGGGGRGWAAKGPPADRTHHSPPDIVAAVCAPRSYLPSKTGRCCHDAHPSPLPRPHHALNPGL